MARPNKKKKIGDLIDSNGQKVTSDEEKSNIIAACFANAQTYGTPVTNNPMVIFGHDFLANGQVISADILPVRLIKPSEIGDVLRRLNNKKSGGHDGIPNYIIIRTYYRIWVYLTLIYNHCPNTGYFPRMWKSSRVIPIIKQGKDHTTAISYRPISLLPSLGKLFEIFILERINEHIEDDNTLKNCQFVFRRGTSKAHPLMALSGKITKGLKNRSATIAVSLDLKGRSRQFGRME